MKRSPAAALVLAALVASGSAGAAGVELWSETRDPRQPALAPERAHLWILGSGLRVEREAGDGRAVDPALVFRGDRRELWRLDRAERTFARFDRSGLEALREDIDSGRRQLRDRLERLAPKRRAAFRRMMQDHAPLLARPRAPRTLVPGDSAGRVGSRACRIYRVMRAGRRVGELCVVAFRELGLARSQFRVFRALGDLYRELASFLPSPEILGLPDEPFELFEDLPGFPVRIRRFEGDAVVRETVFTQFRSTRPAPERFRVPEGFREVAPSLAGVESPQRTPSGGS